MRKLIKKGTKVLTKFGEAKETAIDLCQKEGDKEGIRVDKIWVDLKDRCIFDMDNGHWAYGYQVEVDYA